MTPRPPKTQFVEAPEESESDDGENDAVFGSEQRKKDRKNTAVGAGRRGFLENVTTIKKAREQSKSRERNKPKAEEDLLGRQGNPKILKPEKYMPPKRNEEVFADESQITILTGGGTTQIELIRSFSECELPEPIKRNIELKRYLVPTPIQKAVIPLIKNTKNDIMGHAQTGSGKTAAFLLPIICHIQRLVEARGSGVVNGTHPYALIVVPTKELAEQLYEDARAFAAGTAISVCHTYGHMPMLLSLQEKSAGCDIFIGTCGRIQHFVEEEFIQLDILRFLVLDEADKLLKNEDFFNCVQLIKKHPKLCPSHRCLMFSATFESGAQSLAIQFFRDNFFFVNIGRLNTATDLVVQEFKKVPKFKKSETLVEFLLGENGDGRRELDRTPEGDYWKTRKTLVFVERKRSSDMLAIALRQNNIRALSINSDRTLKQRLGAAEDFASGKIFVLVATDVAARGLNFPGVETVINFDLPEQDAHERALFKYIHRIGRTGRVGNAGHAISYFDPHNPKDVQNAGEYVETLKTTGHEVPDFLLEIVQEQKNERSLCG
uniref:RNA helicase n=1 Tax=Globodera rostochiensis TaxID=31243 RepID=A0A914HGM3_GLORO